MMACQQHAPDAAGQARDAARGPSGSVAINGPGNIHPNAEGEASRHSMESMVLHQIKRIVIEFIPQDSQRYPTVGDWLHGDEGTLTVLVSEMPDPRYQQLVAVHELIEALICNVDGVSQEAVDAFDMGQGADLDEPGNDPAAPYFEQHAIATDIEMTLAAAMGVDWTEYDAAVGDHGMKDAQ